MFGCVHLFAQAVLASGGALIVTHRASSQPYQAYCAFFACAVRIRSTFGGALEIHARSSRTLPVLHQQLRDRIKQQQLNMLIM